MTREEKERLIKDDLASIENRVRHAFNQGYELGRKEQAPTPKENLVVEDCISREQALHAIGAEIVGVTEEGRNILDSCQYAIKHLPSVLPKAQEPVLDKIRAEIDKARFVDKDTRICKNANASGLEVALEIIDKYRVESGEI